MSSLANFNAEILLSKYLFLSSPSRFSIPLPRSLDRSRSSRCSLLALIEVRINDERYSCTKTTAVNNLYFIIRYWNEDRIYPSHDWFELSLFLPSSISISLVSNLPFYDLPSLLYLLSPPLFLSVSCDYIGEMISSNSRVEFRAYFVRGFFRFVFFSSLRLPFPPPSLKSDGPGISSSAAPVRLA